MAFDATAGLSSREKDAFQEFKRIISDEFEDEAADEFRLPREFNIKKAEILLRNHIKWRKDNEIDKIIDNFEAPEVLTKYYPFNIIGFDKEGCPIIVFNFGKTDFKGLLKSVKVDDAFRYITYCLELAQQQLREQTIKLGKLVQTWVYILDFENYSFSQATHKPSIDFLIKCMSYYESNYPETLKTVYIINAPVYFYYIFSILKMFVSARSVQKMRILRRDNLQNELLKSIDPEVLPAYLGGTKTDPDGNPRCITKMVHGGLVPRNLYFEDSENQLSHKPEMKKYILAQKSKIDIVLQIDLAGSFIEWEFDNGTHNIGFGLLFKSSNNGNEQLKELIPIQKVDKHMDRETGTFLCNQPGIYILVLDNSHSSFWSQQVFFKYDVNPPKPEMKDENQHENLQ